jgi:uncharacterized Ntn-hydrolase superfamily protein
MTYSIIARDPNSGAVGVATATGLLAVGANVPHCRFGIGALASQGHSTSPLYADDGMALLEREWEAKEIVDALVSRDGNRGVRQLIIMDRAGRTAGWTGDRNSNTKAHLCGVDFAVAGNCLTGRDVLDAMRTAFVDGRDLPLAERLILAIEAGSRRGGDQRGTVSAALLVDAAAAFPLSLRVDYAANPVANLRELYQRSLRPDYREFLDRLPSRNSPNRG